MATFSKRGAGQWQVKIRRKGSPELSATFPTKKLAEAWAQKTESEILAKRFGARTVGNRTILE